MKGGGLPCGTWEVAGSREVYDLLAQSRGGVELKTSYPSEETTDPAIAIA